MRGIKILIVFMIGGMMVFALTALMGTAFSFGAGGGEIHMFTNESNSVFGDAFAIQGDDNTIGTDDSIVVSGDKNQVSRNNSAPTVQVGDMSGLFTIIGLVCGVIMLLVLFGSGGDDNSTSDEEDWDVRDSSTKPLTEQQLKDLEY